METHTQPIRLDLGVSLFHPGTQARAKVVDVYTDESFRYGQTHNVYVLRIEGGDQRVNFTKSRLEKLGWINA